VPCIHLETRIAAPPERCFDIARSVDLHTSSMAHTGERAVAGVTSGMMDLGDSVTWDARHLGLRWRLTSRITEYDRPQRFVDEQVRGPFRSFRHLHEFRPINGDTLMIDEFDFRAPFGPLGRIAERLFLTRYMRNLLLARNAYLKQQAERVADGT
jgi:ligand-binding SRPBCC domain-containing protein